MKYKTMFRTIDTTEIQGNRIDWWSKKHESLEALAEWYKKHRSRTYIGENNIYRIFDPHDVVIVKLNDDGSKINEELDLHEKASIEILTGVSFNDNFRDGASPQQINSTWEGSISRHI